MNVIDFKTSILNKGILKRATDNWYRAKDCPLCGDSKWHLYLKINLDDGPIGYRCFKCSAHGIADEVIFNSLGIENGLPKFKRLKRSINQTCTSTNDDIKLISDIDDLTNITQYINRRVGIQPSYEDLIKFQFVSNPLSYVNQVSSNKVNPRQFANRLWFKLINGNMSGRLMSDTDEDRWKKCNLFSDRGSGLYVIRNPFDTGKRINACICEGVFDAIGLYYHGNIDNAIFISTQGKDYSLGIKYLLDRGIFGDSVNVGIYKDSDVNNDSIKYDYYYTKIFKNINIHENIIANDYGHPKELIEIHKTL